MKHYWVISPYSSKNEEAFEESWSFDLKNGVIAIGWANKESVSSSEKSKSMASK